MILMRGVELGNIFKLGTRYSEAMGANFVDRDGVDKPVIMGSYGIGSGRLMASICEEYNDDMGLCWPITVAPYEVHLVALHKKVRQQVSDGDGSDKNPDPYSIAERLYNQLLNAGIEVLFDDRDESPGVKFNDADLIGIPIRLTVSKRSIDSGGIEIKLRSGDDREIILPDDIVSYVHNLITDLHAQIDSLVVPVPFEE
jgi:prolyl-tRNA synthetase